MTTIADHLRDLAATMPDENDAGLVTAAAWHLDRLTARLGTALGASESWVRVSEGLNVTGSPQIGPQTAQGGDSA